MDKLTMPKRNSKNPVLGINRCDCGNVRTIHRPKGTRKKFLYSICNDCGTNQQTGAAIQAKMSTYFSTVEELISHEQHADSTKQEQSSGADYQDEPPNGGNLCVEHDDTGGDQQPDSSVPEAASPPKKKKAPWFAVLAGVVVGVATGGAIVRLGN